MHRSARLGLNTKTKIFKCKTSKLVDLSPKDRPWDVHRQQADAVQQIYAKVSEFERYAQRIGDCSGFLRFALLGNEDSEKKLKLREARFCRVRHCPVCQWRRSLMWLARFYQSLPLVLEDCSNARWIFLTLTVRNVPVVELRETLQSMNKAWNRFRLRKEFKPILGWIRTTEVTRGKNGSAHPHFHALLMVPPSMISGVNYIRKSCWGEIWKKCARLDYEPVVDVRAVKKSSEKIDLKSNSFEAVAAETLKYSVKPADMVLDPSWFLEMTRQVYKLRFVATGGLLKDVLRVNEETEKDLILADSENDEPDDRYRLTFKWSQNDKHYVRFEQDDIF